MFPPPTVIIVSVEPLFPARDSPCPQHPPYSRLLSSSVKSFFIPYFIVGALQLAVSQGFAGVYSGVSRPTVRVPALVLSSLASFCLFFVVEPPIHPPPNRCPHSDSKHYCRGKCKLCYMKVSQIPMRVLVFF